MNRSSEAPRIAIAPHVDSGLVEAVQNGGGVSAEVGDAQAIVWTDPFDPPELGRVLQQHSDAVSWVQLPFAGVERFVEAGVIDEGRTWTCTKGVYGHATAEHALLLTLAAARSLHVDARASSWVFGGGDVRRRTLEGATVAVVGTGGIGRALVDMLGPLDASVIAVNRSGTALAGAARTVASSDLHEVLPEADFVVLAAALTDETRGMFDEAAFAAMKPEAWLINVARGGLVDHDALVSALREGTIAGAALDVTDPEPLPDGHPLWELDNVVVTPHVANTWQMALPELRGMVERNVRRFAAGEPLEGVIDPKLGY